jgi:glycosyltransferase involved in cell wall biosynthesis
MVRAEAGSITVAMFCRYGADQPGGVETVVSALSERLAALRGWRVVVVPAFRKPKGVARWPVIGDLIASAIFGYRVAVQHFDAIVVHGAEYAWAPLLVSRLTRVPLALVWHGVRAQEIRATRDQAHNPAVSLYLLIEDLLQRAASMAATQIAVSEAVAADVTRLYKPAVAVETIPNGVQAQPGNRTKSDRNTFNVLWVGSSAYPKGLDVAVAACALARRTNANLRLTVVGLPLNRVGESDVISATWITWLGVRPRGDMPDLYREADLLMCTSRYEAAPMVVLEAMSVGLPVVGAPPVRWLVADAGITMPDWNPIGYAGALLRLSTDATELNGLRGLARQRAMEFSWSKAAIKYATAIEALIGGAEPISG